MSKVIVFGGPSLPRRDWPRSVELRPPAERGELSRLVSEHVVVLLDGVFLHAPSPTHRDLLQLLRSGVILIGAASMGALRATELRDYGMLGVGIVYQAVLEGVVTDDSEVAVGMSPYDFTATTIPLINIRKLLALACREGLPQCDAATAFDAAKQIYFLQRTPAELRRVWGCLPPVVNSRLLPMIEDTRTDLKKRDARTAIEFAVSRLANPIAEPAPPAVELVQEIWFSASPVTPHGYSGSS